MNQLLVAAFIAIAPIVWLYATLGPWLFWLGILTAIAGFIVWGNKKAEQDLIEFHELVEATLQGKFDWRAQKSMNRELMRSNTEQAIALRDVQIIADSLQIAMTSPKRETIEHRLGLAKERLNEIASNPRSQFTEATMALVRNAVISHEPLIVTHMYIEPARRFIDKAKTLKTEKARAKNIEQARSILQEGLSDHRAMRVEIEAALASLDH